MNGTPSLSGFPERSLDAIVMAGGINTRELYPGYQPGYKALIELGGKPFIRHVLDALEGSRCVRQIGIVGSEPDLRPVVGPDYRIAPSGDTPLVSIANGLELFADAPLVLVATGDLAMLRPELVDDFVARCGARDAGTYPEKLFISVVPEDAFTGVYAACKKGLNRFRGAAVCHGNLFVATPSLTRNEEVMGRLNAIYAARKNALTSAMAFGIGLGLAYAFGVHFLHILTLERIAKMASNRFGFSFLPVICPDPRIAIDIDEAADYEIATQVLGAQPAAADGGK
ncbi:MAG: nucleotidyltransferase family protein [Armatimonadetes bacterium]|nr:nucleotidyltransferase family protein [Armatimonadota bacterium]